MKSACKGRRAAKAGWLQRQAGCSATGRGYPWLIIPWVHTQRVAQGLFDGWMMTVSSVSCNGCYNYSPCGRQQKRAGKSLDTGVRWIVQDLNFGLARLLLLQSAEQVP